MNYPELPDSWRGYMSWHYRARKRVLETGEAWFDMVEYYEQPTGWTKDGMTPGGSTYEELVIELQHMLHDAQSYEVLIDTEAD